MRFSKTYIFLFVLVFGAIAGAFNILPRSTYSELEKRELAKRPVLSYETFVDGSFTKEMSSWFSDTEPYRDYLMAFSMHIKDIIRLNIGDSNITFHASATPHDEEDMVELTETDSTETEDIPDHYSYENHITADENAKIANAGIIIVGSGENVRALMAYGGSAKGCVGYARAANQYKDTFPEINIYCMVIPTAVEYYCPDKVRNRTKPQQPTIENVFNHLSPGVKPVDIYTTLGEHADEDIYLRTDHHWAPLGAYYAAEKFAQVADVPFRPLSDYNQKVVHRYVGSMYGYSQDIAIKNAPEDFVYYTPKDVSYTTTYINYDIDENYQVIGVGRPYRGPFFYRFKDGSGGAFCTFMGSDTKLTCVRTSTKNGRRLLILKDSFGNALPGYLFYSFEEIHVVDSRYFTKNMVDYVHENHITDILFANNIFKAYSRYTYSKYIKFLTQKNGIHRPTKTTVDSLHKSTLAKDSLPTVSVPTSKPERSTVKDTMITNP